VRGGNSLRTRGCGTATVQTDEPWSAGPFTEFIDQYVEEASAGGATQEQLDALDAARMAGRVDMEQVRQAIAANAQCLEESGFTVSVGDGVKASGYVVPQYDAAFPADLSTEQADALVDVCERKNSFWISSAYQLQPEARDRLGAYVMSRAPQRRQCLDDHGYSTDPEATGWELAMQSLQILRDTPGDNSVDCLSASGIDGL
jgi:hypothetical protein